MEELALVFVGAALVNNFVLTRFLGLCPFLGVSTRLDSAVGMALATAFVLTLSAVVSHLVDRWLLAPLGLTGLRTIAFVLVIAATVQLTELSLRAASPLLHRVLGLYLPLITSNCAVLGVALLNTREPKSLLASATFGLGAAAGFALALILFTALRERLAAADVPEPFRGPGIGLVTAGLMALAFMGFAGMGRP